MWSRMSGPVHGVSGGLGVSDPRPAAGKAATMMKVLRTCSPKLPRKTSIRGDFSFPPRSTTRTNKGVSCNLTRA
jgi:hypothetical protein